MKKIFFTAAVLAVISGTSCTKDENVAPAQVGEVGKATLQVSVPVDATKATTTPSEDAVSSLQVFVFRTEDGTLDAYQSAENTTLTVNCTTGEKDIVALVNAPDMTEITTLTGLKTAVSNLSDNEINKFVMYGIDEKVNVTEGNSYETITVSRLVARIGISKITNDFSLPQYQQMDFLITGIYLVNAVGDVQYDGTSSPSVWYNKGGNCGDLTDLLYDECDNCNLDYGESYTTWHYFYCYPNPTEAESDAASFTRLVVETTLDGTTWYYPVNIEGIESNHAYDIELTITRLGSSSADEAISMADAEFTISVTDWTEETTETVEI